MHCMQNRNRQMDKMYIQVTDIWAAVKRVAKENSEKRREQKHNVGRDKGGIARFLADFLFEVAFANEHAQKDQTDGQQRKQEWQDGKEEGFEKEEGDCAA